MFQVVNCYLVAASATPTSFTALRLRSLGSGNPYGIDAGSSNRTSLSEIDFKAGGSEISKTSTTAFEGGVGSVNSAASNAFDDNTGTGWSRTGTDGSCYAGLRGYPSAVTPDAITLVGPSTTLEAPAFFTIEGSNDTTTGSDGTWYILYVSASLSWTAAETKNFSITASAPVIVPNEYPTITGSDHSVGQTLTCSTGTWGYTPTSYAYQWKKNGVSIGGATSSSYTVQAGDSGAVLTCEVTATNVTGSTTAVGGPIVGGQTAHRYWRIKVTAVNGGGSFVAASEIEMREAPNVGSDLCNGGTALADSAFAGLPASNAFDNKGDLSTLWANNGTGTAAYIGYDFGSGVTKNINQVHWTARNDGSYTQYPTAFTVDYSDDGSSWTSKWTESSVTFTQGQRQSFIP
jgi:hypothetical protein